MTTIEVTLPDDLAWKATTAGLLSAEAIQDMLQERLPRRAGESLREIHGRMPGEELTPQNEQEIFEAVQAYRAERRARSDGLMAVAPDPPHIAFPVTARAHFIVTGDRTHLPPIGTHGGIAIVSPRR